MSILALPFYSYSRHTIGSPVYPSFSVLTTFSPSEAGICRSTLFPRSMSASRAQLSSETNSWACMHLCQLGSYLVFFCLSWHQAPLGALSAWEHKGSPGASPLHTTYIILFDKGSLELLLTKAVVSYNRIASWWVVFIPFQGWNPNSQPLPPDGSSWQKGRKKNNKVNPKEQLQQLHVQNPAAYPKTNNFLPQHTDPLLLRSICKLTSSRWLHWNTNTVQLLKNTACAEKQIT